MLVVMIPFFAASRAGAESFKSWAARGAREQRENDPKSAASSYSNALTLWTDDDGEPGKAKVLCARSSLREKDGDEAGAMSDLSACLAIDKKNSKSFHHRGVLLLKAGKAASAISDFYKAIALDIRFGQAYADRAAAYEGQGEMGFAREDYRHACELGVKPACAKAKELSPPSAKDKAKAKASAAKPPAKSAASKPAKKPAGNGGDKPSADAAAPAPPDAPAPGEAAASEEKPAPVAEAPPPRPSYSPRYKDCLRALDACVEAGDSFGACVNKAPNCDVKAVKGCCPAACHKAYQRASRDRSEAQAFRENFSPTSACGKPPKIVEEE